MHLTHIFFLNQGHSIYFFSKSEKKTERGNIFMFFSSILSKKENMIQNKIQKNIKYRILPILFPGNCFIQIMKWVI